MVDWGRCSPADDGAREAGRMVTIGDGLSPSLTYEPFYGLREKPFSLSADPRFLYNGPSHVRAFEQLLAGIRRREGLIVLTGEIGTGKTTLCRGVLGALDRRTFTTFVRDPFLSREDLLKTLLIDFGVMSIEDLKSGRLSAATRPELSYPLYEFLDSLVPLQAFAVLIIDEAQNLSTSLLDEIRILSELEAREKLLQVVLVGQPELRSNLRLPQLRQVDQRVSVRCELAPLPVEEVSSYIAHRLGVASVGEPAVGFTSEAARLVWRASGGVPRVMNLICDRALHCGFTTRANDIDAAIVFGAIEDLGRTLEPDAASERETAPGAASERTPRPAAAFPAGAPPASEERGHVPPARPAELPPSAQTELADPLAEFSHEADLVRPDRRHGRSMVVTAALVLSALAGAGVWYAQTELPLLFAAAAEQEPPRSPALFDQTTPERRDRRAAPAPPVQPVAGSVDPEGGAVYVIQVASFQSHARAGRLLEELTALGYRAVAMEVDLGSRGIWRQVMVGRYATSEDAEPDLVTIRQIPSYEDARVVALTVE